MLDIHNLLRTLADLKVEAKKAWQKAGTPERTSVRFTLDGRTFSVVAFQVSREGLRAGDKILTTIGWALHLYWECGGSTLDDRHILDFTTFINEWSN